MKPVVTPEEMRAIDDAASVGVDVLIQRAGWAVARTAREMLGGHYGRRVAVVVGKGNNGADGRAAAHLLEQQGVSVQIIDADTVSEITNVDLVIDAAYGTGFHGEYKAPTTSAPVLSVDIPSGLNGLTGVGEGAVQATRTVTFAALKPGLILGNGPNAAGEITVADIGLTVDDASIYVVEDSDIAAIRNSKRDAHKWQTALIVIAGGPGMMGSATFATHAAERSGSGMVRLGSPGVSASDLPIGEAVAIELPRFGWQDVISKESERAKAIVVGPGLGREEGTISSVRSLLEQSELPVVVDGDGLFAIAEGDGPEFLKHRQAPTVLTPHDGEYKRLTGSAPSADRISDARELAKRTGAIVLMKGSTTVVADPDGHVLISTAGSSRLGTAGTGDVLSGIIGAFLARGVQPIEAAAFGAHVHGEAAKRGFAQGLIASDLPKLVAKYLSEVS